MIVSNKVTNENVCTDNDLEDDEKKRKEFYKRIGHKTVNRMSYTLCIRPFNA